MGLVEALNAVGVALASNPSSTQSKQSLGSNLTVAALGIQLAVILAGEFHRRCKRAGIYPRAISTPLGTLYASMALILIRCVYRLVEHAGGTTTVKLSDPESLKVLSPLVRFEWFFYVFEAAIMLLNSALWNAWNPGRYLPRSRRVYLAWDGRTECEGREGPDERPLLKKAGAVLTFGFLFAREKGEREFEELGDYAGGRPRG